MAKSRSPKQHSALYLALQELSQKTGVQREDLLEALTGKLSELRRCWGINLAYRTQTEREQAIGAARLNIRVNLDRHITLLRPMQRAVPNVYRYAVNLGFNLQTRPEQAHLRDQDITRRRDWLEHEAPIHLRVSASTSYRYVAHAITQIEQQIVESGYKPLQVEPARETTDGNPLYVPRKELHERFTQLIDSGAKLIVFHGLPGMGKSWIARELTRLVNGAEAPLIRVTGDSIETRDLQAALQRYSIRTQSAITGDATDYLAMLLCDDQSPPFLILDNLESAEKLRELLPPIHMLRHSVVATCRHKGSLTLEGIHFIRVKKMSADEAEKMVKTLLPKLSSEEARLIVRSFDGYPLVTRYVCELYRQQRQPVEEFCSELLKDVTALAEYTYTQEGKTLLAVLRRSIREIKRQNESAYELLAVLTFQRQPARITESGVRVYIEYSELSSLKGLQAITLLFDMALIEQLYYESDSGQNVIGIHPFARTILARELAKDTKILVKITKRSADLHFSALTLIYDLPPEAEYSDVPESFHERVQDMNWMASGVFQRYVSAAEHEPALARRSPELLRYCQRALTMELPTLAEVGKLMGRNNWVDSEWLDWAGRQPPLPPRGKPLFEEFKAMHAEIERASEDG